MTLTFRRNPVNYDLRHELKNLRLGREDLREDLVKEDNTESNCLSAKDLETFDDDQKLQSDIKGFEKDEDEAEVVSDLVAVVESFDQNSKKLSPFEEAGLRLTLLQMKSFKHNSGQGLLAAESFGNANFLSLATEDLKSKFKDIKDNVTKVVIQIWEKVANLIREFFSRDKKLITKSRNLIETLEKTNIDAGIEMTNIDPPQTIFLKGILDSTSSKQILDNVTNLFDLQTKEIATAVSSKYPMGDEKFKEILITAIMALGESSGKLFGSLDVSRLHPINDSWIFTLHNIEDKESSLNGLGIPTIVRGSNNQSSKTKDAAVVKTLSNSDMINLTKQIISILETNIENDLQTANAVLQKFKKDSRLDQTLTQTLNKIGKFISLRTKLRYDICYDFINFFGHCLAITKS